MIHSLFCLATAPLKRQPSKPEPGPFSVSSVVGSDRTTGATEIFLFTKNRTPSREQNNFQSVGSYFISCLLMSLFSFLSFLLFPFSPLSLFPCFGKTNCCSGKACVPGAAEGRFLPDAKGRPGYIGNLQLQKFWKLRKLQGQQHG